MASSSAHIRAVPADFPRSRPHASLAGAQPKLAVRLVDGQYIATFSEDEAVARFEMCDDLLLQLFPYCLRKRAEHPEWGLHALLDKVASALEVKGWHLTDGEIEWLLKHLGERLEPTGGHA